MNWFIGLCHHQIETLIAVTVVINLDISKIQIVLTLIEAA